MHEPWIIRLCQRDRERRAVRERTIGPARAAVAAVRWRDSSRGAVAAATWSTLETGAPVLSDCAAAFDCRIIDVASVGTHDVLFCSVAALQRSDGATNLIYFGRDYHVVRVGPA